MHLCLLLIGPNLLQSEREYLKNKCVKRFERKKRHRETDKHKKNNI